MDIEGQGQGPEAEADGAEQAFEALREEVAALRRGIELIYRQNQGGRATVEAGPDYSLTLGQMQKALEAVTARLGAIEGKPALAVTPGQQAAELRRELHQAGEDVRHGTAHGQTQLDRTVRELRGMIDSALMRHDQTQWLWAIGGIGVTGGAFLWFMLSAMLPWGGGTWLAGLAFGGRWSAGEVMMRDADPATWDRMVRLYKACPQDRTTELCEAAMAVRTVPPKPEAVQPGKPVVPVAPVRPHKAKRQRSVIPPEDQDPTQDD